jgi:hypothetical protein
MPKRPMISDNVFVMGSPVPLRCITTLKVVYRGKEKVSSEFRVHVIHVLSYRGKSINAVNGKEQVNTILEFPSPRP